MDMMLLGEMITASGGSQTHTGFWMPAGGNNGVGGVEVFFQSVANGFTVHMDTKSSDEPDSAATLSIGSVTLSSTSPATYKFDVGNARDLVRYRVVSGEGALVHLQFAQPLWQPN
jgi:hypothetical protein